MNSLEINDILKPRLRGKFLGVFASDALPVRVKVPCGVVVNLDPRTQSGSHWVAVYFDKNRVASYMDSFGLPPLVPAIAKFIQRNCTKSIFNSKQIQHKTSIKCGKFCIVYLLHRSKGRSNKTFQTAFKSLQRSDTVVEQMYKRLVSIKSSSK